MSLDFYLDESVDEDGFLVLAGYVSTAERWSQFSEQWRAELPNAVRKKGGAIEFKMNLMGKFPATMEKLAGFHRIIHGNALMGISVALRPDDLFNARKRLHIKNIHPDWEEQFTPYYMAARLMVENFNNFRVEQPDEFPFSGPVNFVFDDIQQKDQVLAIWDAFVADRPEDQRELYGAKPRFEDSTIELPLQAADFLAWWVRKWANEHDPVEKVPGSFRGFAVSEIEIPYLRLSFTEDQLFEIIRGWAVQNIIRHGFNPALHPISDLGEWRAPEVEEWPQGWPDQYPERTAKVRRQDAEPQPPSTRSGGWWRSLFKRKG